MGYRSARPLRDNERSLIDVLCSLDEKYPDILIIVEGKRDVRVLRDLGVTAQVIRTQTHRTREELVEKIASEAGKRREVLILTDFDAEGTEIAKHLEKNLEHHKIRILYRLRTRIRNLMGNWRCIEEIVAVFKRRDLPEPLR